MMKKLDDDDNNNRKTADDNAGQDYEIVVFDVGGTKFKTYRKTLTNHPRCMLADASFLDKYYNTGTKEYFFDRDPDMFKVTLNYLRTDELHLPSYICGPAAKTELLFWGISPKTIERCCWLNYNEWNSTQKSLKRLERDRKLSMSDQVHENNSTFWTKWRPVVWRMLNRSNSSLLAKIFGFVSLLFVVISIFSFLADTTEPFAYYSTENANEDTDYLQENHNSTASPNRSDETSTPAGSMNNSLADDNKKKLQHPALYAIDMSCLFYFILEYSVRFVFAPKKLKYAISLLAVIDILAILTDIVELIIDNFKITPTADVNSLNFVTVVRVIRILRIFRLIRHSSGLWILLYTLRASVGELMLLVWFMALGVLVFSSLIYYVEEKGKFKSIPDGFWWALITMTTVGYGDIYPETTGGKVVGSLCAMCGVLMVGFSVPALVSNFILYYRHVEFATQMEEAEVNISNTRSKPGDSTNMQCEKDNEHETTNPAISGCDKLTYV